MVLVSRCCCCFSLRSGMLTLGWVQAVLSVSSLCGVILLDTSASSSSSLHRWIGASFRTLYVLLGGSVIQTIAAGFLLFGVYNNRSSFVFEYVKLETLLHVGSLLEFLLYLALEHASFTTDQIYTFLVFLAINYGLAVYYLLAAYSYYQTMIREEHTPLLRPEVSS